MDLIVYLNGNFVKAGDAKVSIYDHGFLYGDGVFETMRAYKRVPFKFQEHIQRMHNSLKQIGMELPIAPNVILKAIKLLIQYNQISEAYIRITITRGEGPIGLDTDLCPDPTTLVIAEPLHKNPHSWYANGIPIAIVSYRKIPDVSLPNSIKSCNYLINILAKKEALYTGAQEGIMLNMEGYVTEGTTSNIFTVKDRKIFTPALSSGILDGITRQTVIELAERRNIEVIERHILPKEIFTADECFITSSAVEIVPVISCDGTQINKAEPGKITRLLMRDYQREIERHVEEERTVKV